MLHSPRRPYNSMQPAALPLSPRRAYGTSPGHAGYPSVTGTGSVEPHSSAVSELLERGRRLRAEMQQQLQQVPAGGPSAYSSINIAPAAPSFSSQYALYPPSALTSTPTRLATASASALPLSSYANGARASYNSDGFADAINALDMSASATEELFSQLYLQDSAAQQQLLNTQPAVAPTTTTTVGQLGSPYKQTTSPRGRMGQLGSPYRLGTAAIGADGRGPQAYSPRVPNAVDELGRPVSVPNVAVFLCVRNASLIHPSRGQNKYNSYLQYQLFPDTQRQASAVVWSSDMPRFAHIDHTTRPYTTDMISVRAPACVLHIVLIL